MNDKIKELLRSKSENLTCIQSDRWRCALDSEMHASVYVMFSPRVHVTILYQINMNQIRVSVRTDDTHDVWEDLVETDWMDINNRLIAMQ